VTLLNGEWQSRIFSGGWMAAQGGTLETIEPATGEVLAEVGLAGKADVAEAARRARAAQPEWAAKTGPERAALIRRAARIVEDNHEEFEGWLVREGGCVPGKAAFEAAPEPRETDPGSARRAAGTSSPNGSGSRYGIRRTGSRSDL